MTLDADTLTAADGTVFAIQSEHVRGEPRSYWLVRKDRGTSSYVADAHPAYDDTTDKRKAHRMLRRRVAEYNKAS